ncbi:MAG: hypothetical protein U0Q15_00690 [Kineosporiaceae bacterium]
MDELLFLGRADVARCLSSLDCASIVEATLLAHADGRTDLPAEGYLGWTTTTGAAARSLALLGSVPGPDQQWYGMKLINAAIDNPSRGMERAGGLGFLFDPLTARPRALMEVGLISAARTAGYSLATLRRVEGLPLDEIAVVGCGALARAHLDLLVGSVGLSRVHLHDLAPARAEQLAAWLAERHPRVAVELHPSVASLVKSSRLLLTLTTADEGYLHAGDLLPGTLVLNVSLGDLADDVFLTASAVLVDDLDLVRENPRRPLGRLLAAGEAVALRGSLAELIRDGGRLEVPADGVAVSNPFGMGVLDVALMGAIVDVATRDGLGSTLSLA